jgi:hypothetical protein
MDGGLSIQGHGAGGLSILLSFAYRNFIALWERADPELQPWVAVAREALRRLE